MAGSERFVRLRKQLDAMADLFGDGTPQDPRTRLQLIQGRLSKPRGPLGQFQLEGQQDIREGPELIAGIETTSWTQDRLIRQASLKEVRERTDRGLRPDWINLPGD